MLYAGDDLVDGQFECANGFVGSDSNGGRVCVPFSPDGPSATCGQLDAPVCTGVLRRSWWSQNSFNRESM